MVKKKKSIHSEKLRKIKKRPSWDDYFMELAKLVATRSTCLRHAVGAVLVNNKRILATGYNGSPRGLVHCLEIGCLRDKLKIPSGTRAEICRAIHAEQNAVIQCAIYGVHSEGSTIYTTHEPCSVCSKLLISAGVKRIVFSVPYPDEFAQKLLKEAKIKVERWQEKNKKIIIGLTGPMGSGHGMIAEYLKKKGFFYSSTSDRVREECRRKGIEVTRNNLQDVADGLRRRFGPEILSKRTWKIVVKHPLAIIDGIRGIAEVEFFKSKPNFYLLGITAPRKIRFQRVVARHRESDPTTWKGFLTADKKDFKSGQGKFGRNITACLKKADFLVVNDGTIKQLEKKVERWLEKFK